MTERPHGFYKNVHFELYGQDFDGAILRFTCALSEDEFEIAKKICPSFRNLHPGDVGDYCFYRTDCIVDFESSKCCSCGYRAMKYVTEREKKWHFCKYCFIEYNIACVKHLVFQIIDAIKHYYENGLSFGSDFVEEIL